MIKFLDLQKINLTYQPALDAAVCDVVRSGRYLQGSRNAEFEAAYASFIGTRHAVGCANGLDALYLLLRAHIELGRLQPGDEVLVPANTYIATILAITNCGLQPVLVEPDSETLQIDPVRAAEAVTSRTRAMMIVHLYGRCAYSDQIAEVCRRHGLLLFEDNAQAHGCRYGERRTGSLGNGAAHSFYPGKNLGALGDGGAVTTDDADVAQVVRALGNYGSSRKYVFPYRGRNSRLDEIQAAVLSVKLPRLDADNARRMAIARLYREGIDNPAVRLPGAAAEGSDVCHLFPVFADDRDDLQRHLADRGVQTLIHYPIPPHQQECYAGRLGGPYPVTERIHRTELSLPVSPVLTDDEARTVIDAVNSWHR